MIRYAYLFVIFLLASCELRQTSSQGKNFTSKVDQVSRQKIDDSKFLEFFNEPTQSIETAFNPLPTGSVKPAGWIAKMMSEDIKTGMIANLPKHFPSIINDDIYHQNRRGGLDDVPDMGDLVLVGDEWETSIMWWNAETIGNWWDGYVRHAYLVDDRDAIHLSEKIVDRLLKSQDESGYIGIYKPNLRYQHKGSNGELWAQTTAFRMLLAYYEFTDSMEVLTAVVRAMKLTMQAYGPSGSNPFDLTNEFGGVTHGLMLTDVCESLHRITGNSIYRDYATFLYRSYSTFGVNRAFNDLRYSSLILKDKAFSAHAVHTYEHFRSLLQAYYHTGFDELKTATDNAFYKLKSCILPSGAGHGNEWIAELPADPTKTATEFCALLELRNSYSSALFKTGNLEFADNAEKITFNAMMGFRDEAGKAITYGKADNAYQLDGQHYHTDGKASKDPRFKYSPVHSDPAVCCVPNYGRNMSYYLDQMWGKKDENLYALMYGPSTFSTLIKGVNVNIDQKTAYPFEDSIVMEVNLESLIDFSLVLRIPSWSKSVQINGENQDQLIENGFLKLKRRWEKHNTLEIVFERAVEQQSFGKEVYYQHGPLVYALPIEHKKKIIKTYDNNQFSDYYALPINNSWSDLSMIKNGKATLYQTSNLANSWPWHNASTYINAEFYNHKDGEIVTKKLLPLGSTTLRKLTFYTHE